MRPPGEARGEGDALQIRPLREADLEAVLAIERASFPTPWTREHFRNEMHRQRFARCLALTVGGAVVGYACLWLIHEELRINNIAVEPARRRAGLGGRLLRHLLELGRDAGCRLVTLEVRPSNAAALRLYRAHGFREIGRRPGYYSDTREDGVLMELELGPRTA